MDVGTSQPTVVAAKDGGIGMKNQMQAWESRHSYIYIYRSMSYFLVSELYHIYVLF